MSMSLIRGDHVLEGFTPGDAPVLHADAGILIGDGRVLEIGDGAALQARHPDAAILGGPGHVIIPGLINGHHHVGFTPLQLGSPDHPLELWFASRMAADMTRRPSAGRMAPASSPALRPM